MKHAINWFEIPVTDFKRATAFYAALIGQPLQENEMGGYKMGLFPYDEESVSGCLCQGEGYVPSKQGVRIYLNGGDDLAEMLAKVEPAGGKVTQPKTLIDGQHGYFAFFEDTEGNSMALHSMS